MADRRFWHGGAPGLAAGEVIEPRGDDQRHLVDGCPTCEARKAGQQLSTDPVRLDRIYITTEKDYARLYAAGYPRGGLYIVEPIGELEETTGVDDPAPSWACPAARVLSVYDPLVVFTPHETRRILRRYRRRP
jgi:hypothetical protein